MRKLILLMTISCFMIAACQTTKINMQSFHGKSRAYLVGRLGPPDAKEPDDKGGEIWIYQEREVSVSPGTVDVYKDKDGVRTTVRKEKRIYPPKQQVRIINRSFYIDKNGIIYDTAYGFRDILY